MARDPNARLVYSTEGAVPPEPEKREKPAKARGSRPADNVIGIRLRLERRASGRVVTVVTGFQGSEAEVAALAKMLKAACGAGGTVKDGALELQGDHRDKVEAALRARGLASKRAGG